MRTKSIILALTVLLAAGCSKEGIKTVYSRQENNIESFINARMKADSTLTLVHKDGVERLTVVQGEGDSLAADGNVSFLYAGYVLSSSTISQSNLFDTNNAELASSIKWEVSDSSKFKMLTLNLAEADLVEGLKKGLKGVKGGEECYILFSGKYGFGKRPLGTIPANSALAYHLWVHSISND